MGFNFGGAMRGLGAGLVSSGALLEKFNERKFEEEQLKVKLDREEHMARLAREAQSAENVLNRAHAETLQQGSLTHAEKMTGMQMTQNKENADRAYGLDMKRLQGEQAERSANAAYRAQESAANDAHRKASLTKESDQMIIFKKEEAALDRFTLKLAGGDKEKAQQMKDQLQVASALGLNKDPKDRLPPQELAKYVDEKNTEAAEKLPRESIKKIKAQWKDQYGEEITSEEAKAYWKTNKNKTELENFGYSTEVSPKANDMLFNIMGGNTPKGAEDTSNTTIAPPKKVERTPENALGLLGKDWNPEEPPSIYNVPDYKKGQYYAKQDQEGKAAIEQEYGKATIQRWLRAIEK